MWKDYIYIWLYYFEVGLNCVGDNRSLSISRLHLWYLVSYPFRIGYIKGRRVHVFANKESSRPFLPDKEISYPFFE